MLKFDYTEEQSANLISVIGVFNTIGMIFLGWTGDQPWLNIPKTYAICLVCKYLVVLVVVFSILELIIIQAIIAFSLFYFQKI